MPEKMKIVCISVILFIALSTAVASTVHAREVQILSIYWRGKTEVSIGFKDGLKELGIQAVITEFNAKKDKKALIRFLDGVEDGQYDLIRTFGTTVTSNVSKKIKKTPILAKIGNPVASGIIKSWQSSGNNIIAVSQIVAYPEQVNFIASIGAFKRIGSIRNPKEKNSVVDNRELSKHFKMNDMDFIVVDASSDDEIDGAVAELIKRKVDFVYLSSSLVTTNTDKVIPVLNDHKIPTYARSESIIMKENGAMAGIVSSYYEVGKELAYRAKLVLDGKKPSEVPSYRMPLERQRILINKKTAEQLDIIIPYNILRRAEVYPEQ